MRVILYINGRIFHLLISIRELAIVATNEVPPVMLHVRVHRDSLWQKYRRQTLSGLLLQYLCVLDSHL